MFELTGPLRKLSMPPLCAACGLPPSTHLVVERVCNRPDDENGRVFLVESIKVPFCARCAELHQRESQPVPLIKQLAALFRSELIIPALAAGAFALLFARNAVQEFFEADFASALLWTAPLAFFAIISAASFRVARKRTRRFTLPPPTSVTSAFDFSDDESGFLEPERRTYRLRNEPFAKAFLAANRDRVWTAQKSARAAGRRFLVWIAAGAAFAVWLVWTLFFDQS